MQINSANNNLNFTSVIPTRVFVNGLPTTNPKFIRQACHKVTKIMAGPVQKGSAEESFLKTLDNLDNGYHFNIAQKGYCKRYVDYRGNIVYEQPSDYFKIIDGKEGKHYITTGQESIDISNIGRTIGIQKLRCNEHGFVESIDHKRAKDSYKNYVQSIISDISRRLKGFPKDLFSQPQPATMDIYVTAKEGTSKGESILRNMNIQKLEII